MRPPEDYELDRAIGTTYSLDLLALLTSPLAFAAFESEDGADTSKLDPVAMLQILRRHASRITIFCDAGRIQVPAKSQLLYGYLEKSVIEVSAPETGGVFHPKLWALRYVSKADRPICYRVVVLSRNLTFDRSWDTVLALDGVVRDRTLGYAHNRPLADFIAALPELAKQKPPPHSVLESIDTFERELRLVEFELPEGFKECLFWPLGIEGYRAWPFREPVDRMLVISPFISESVLEHLGGDRKNNVLISRPDSFDSLDRKSLGPYSPIYEFKPDADLNAFVGDESAEDDTEQPLLRGLHAKLYIADAGWDARVWTGSANATAAAFARNVEFLVELVGKKSRSGIDACLERKKGVTNFVDLLQLLPATPAPNAPDLEQAALDALAEQIRKQIAITQMIARIEADGASLFRVQVRTAESSILKQLPDTTIRCRPITLGEGAKALVAHDSDILVEFSGLSFEALTSFYAFELVVKKGQRSTSQDFVLNLQLEGAPEDRDQRILTTTLRDRAQVMRFLMLLLAWDDDLLGGGSDWTRKSTESEWGTFGTSGELFEAMMQAIVRSPNRLDEIAHLVADLSASKGGTALLPDGFEKIWIPIRAAMERMKP